MPTGELPARANLENLRKQAKALHRAFRDGADDAVQRVRDHLPRAEALSDADLRAADLSLQEAQHVLAKEYGLASWDHLKQALATAGFDDLARLDDREIQALLREVSQRDLTRALIDAPEAVRGRCLSNMSRRVRGYIAEEMEQLRHDLPEYEPAASRQRLLEWAEALSDNGRITWPPPADAAPWEGEDPLVELEREGVPQGPPPGLDDFDLDDLVEGFGEMATVVSRDGILALEEAAATPSPFQEGVRLAVDGTRPELIETILSTRRETMVRNRQLRLRLFIAGAAALQAGDKPFIVRQKLQVHYLDEGVCESPERFKDDMTAADLRAWAERGWLATRTPSTIADLFLHLACCARFSGLPAVGEVLELIDPPFLRQALTLVVARRETAQVEEEMAPLMERELAELEGKLRAIHAGVVGIAGRKGPDEVREAVRQAGAG